MLFSLQHSGLFSSRGSNKLVQSRTGAVGAAILILRFHDIKTMPREGLITREQQLATRASTTLPSLLAGELEISSLCNVEN